MVVADHRLVGMDHHPSMRTMDPLRMPLRRPPALEQIGCSRHGRVARERYRLDGVWGLHLYLYQGAVEIDGRRVAFAPDQLTITPPGAELVWHFPRDAVHHYCLLRFPAASASDVVDVPALHRLGPATARGVREGWERAIAGARTEASVAAAWAWDLLWRLRRMPTAPSPVLAAAGVPGAGAGAVHPALQNALALIAADPGHPWSLTGLAHRVGSSPNHLLRLFRARLGTTVMAYVRQQRVRLALRLLSHGSMPVREVARQIGITDHQAMNRFMRRETGSSPRRWRSA